MFTSTYSIAQGPPPGVGGPPSWIGQNPTVVYDSLKIMNRLYANERFVVDSLALFRTDIKVQGSARIHSDIRVDLDLRVDGTSRLNGEVEMASLGGIPNSYLDDGTVQFVVVLPNGQLKKGTKDDLIEILYKPDVSFLCETPHPNWASELNKIYSSCPNVFVGIGNNAPAHRLHVTGVNYAHNFLAGNVNASNDALYNGFSNNTSQDLIQLGVTVGGTTQFIRFNISNKGAVDITNIGAATSLRIHNGTGHAMVAYASNGTKILQLEDNGLLRAREVKVDEITWPDYVFDKNYKLPKLTDVAKFINKNNHLPGVPTAEEIKTDGLNLGDMQTIQMQKIEELTLYMIEMDEKMSVMETRMNELEKENLELKKTVK